MKYLPLCALLLVGCPERSKTQVVEHCVRSEDYTTEDMECTPMVTIDANGMTTTTCMWLLQTNHHTRCLESIELLHYNGKIYHIGPEVKS